jgi:hypothetical protein
MLMNSGAPFDRRVTAFPWLALALFLGFSKLVVLVFDSNPQVYLGDSMSYLTTAIKGWIPSDRSFVYGFLVHDVTSRARSLSSLVAVQTFAGVLTAWLTAVILVRFIGVRFGVAAVVAVAFALEPQQLLYERFVLTESVSTAFFALFVLVALEYVRSRRIWALITIQILGIVLIAFRMTFLPMLAITTATAPFFACVVWNAKERKRTLLLAAVHLSIGVALWLGLHTAYKNWNGSLSKMPPAYIYSDGFFLIANVSPLVTPADNDDPKLAPVLLRPLAYVNASDQIFARNAETFLEDGLVERIKGALKDDYQANIEAKRIAYRVMRRDPLGFIRLAIRTYLKLYSKEMADIMRGEEGQREMTPDEVKFLSFYHLDANGLPQMKTLTRQYHFAARPLYILLVHTPLVLLASLLFVRRESRKLVWFLVVLITVHVAAVQVAGAGPSFRHHHAATVVLAISMGVFAGRFWGNKVQATLK